MTFVDVAADAGAVLGECPLWSPADAVLYWLDIEGRAVHRYDPATQTDESRPLAVRPGSVALTERPGRLLMAAEHQLGWYQWEGAAFSPIVDLEPGGTGNRLNDGRTDRRGRFWVGSMYERSAAGRFTGMLHRIETDLSTVTTRREIGVSNAIAFSPDGRTMYFADSMRATVWRYDYDPDTGEPSNERVFTDFADLPGRPDGAAVDAAGGLWIACVYGWAVARLTPRGVVDRIIELPVEKPSMPAFGGDRLDTLFVTSISEGTDPARPQPHAGALFAIGTGHLGIAETPFPA